MKKALSAFLLPVLMLSCSNEDAKGRQTDLEESVLTVSVDTGTSTKAPYLDSEPCEAQANDVRIFVFDSEGRLNAYASSPSTTGISLVTTVGDKTVWAVVNGPEFRPASTLDELLLTIVDLGDNSPADGAGFVMTGSAEVCVGKTEMPVSVNVRRLTSRIAVCGIVNNLPPAYPEMIVESVFLTNVPGNQNLSGTAGISTWYNKAGRTDDGSETLIGGDASAASCPELTFAEAEETIPNGGRMDKTYRLYSYPNGVSSDVSGPAFPFTARKTRLVVAARIAGKRYYYPVTLKSLERNKAYTVNITVTALGTEDPEIMVEKDTFASNVIIESWQPGSEYTETI